MSDNTQGESTAPTGAKVRTVVPVSLKLKDQRLRYMAVCAHCAWMGKKYLAFDRAASEMEKHNFGERRKHAKADLAR